MRRRRAGGVQCAAFNVQHKAEGRHTVLVAAHRHRIVAVLADKICCTVDGVQIPHAARTARGRGGIFLAYDGVARKGGQDAAAQELFRLAVTTCYKILMPGFLPNRAGLRAARRRRAPAASTSARAVSKRSMFLLLSATSCFYQSITGILCQVCYHIASIRPLHGRETGLLARTYSATSSGISTLPRHNTGHVRSAS